MARLLSLDECPLALRNHLLQSLRSQDEAVLLPQAQRVAETGAYKNVVFRLSGTETNVPTDIFNSKWYEGVSAVKIEPKYADALLKTPESRQAAKDALRTAIASETASSDVTVGCGLDHDGELLDKSDWVCGFDGPGCCVGLFTAEHSCAPVTGRKGMNRVHATTYLVCKAGSGLAGSTFHSRLMTALKKGATLEECLETGDPGPQALRRLEKAGSRNRARILLEASKALGIPMLESVPDQSSKGKYRTAVTHVDVHVNSIRKIDAAIGSKQTGSVYQYTTAVDAVTSQGLVTMSNISDGLILFLSEAGEVRVNLRNEGFSSIPFATKRLLGDNDLLRHVVAEHKAAKKHNDWAHVDAEFVKERFTWQNRAFSTSAEADVDLEPLCLWGSHEGEDFCARFSRELGIASCQVVRLRPAIVCLAAMESGKLRAALRNIASTA